MTTTVVGRVLGLWRYPVKSMGGETLARAEVGEDGMIGDRAFGVIDAATGVLLSAKRVPRLLSATALYRTDGEVDIVLPAGSGAGPAAPMSTSVSSDDPDVDRHLSLWLGRPVRLERPAAGERATCEIETDLDDAAVVHRWQVPPGRFTDSPAALHLLTPASLRAAAALHPAGQWTVPRFRPGLLVETPEGAQGWVEDAWAGAEHHLEVGGVSVRGRKPCERCIITTREQPGIPADKEILRTLAAFHDACLGIYLDVTGPGTVLVGDDVVLDERA